MVLLVLMVVYDSCDTVCLLVIVFVGFLDLIVVDERVLSRSKVSLEDLSRSRRRGV